MDEQKWQQQYGVWGSNIPNHIRKAAARFIREGEDYFAAEWLDDVLTHTEDHAYFSQAVQEIKMMNAEYDDIIAYKNGRIDVSASLAKFAKMENE